MVKANRSRPQPGDDPGDGPVDAGHLRSGGAVGDALQRLSDALMAEDRRKLATAMAGSLLGGDGCGWSSVVADDVRAAAETMEAIADAVDALNDAIGMMAAGDDAAGTDPIDNRIATLFQAFHNIAKVFGLIEAIARETNLLALNATIEAATVGGVDTDFAAAVGVLKLLAAHSAETTADIRERIAAIHGEMAIMTLALGGQPAGMTPVEVRDADPERLGAAIGSIAEVSLRMAKAATAVTEQAAAVAQISRCLQAIRDDSSDRRQRLIH